MHRDIPPRVFAVAVSASALLAPSVNASIIGVAGDVQLISAPADARINALTSSDWVRVWNEQQNVTLTSGVIVDAQTPGLYDQEADLGTFELHVGAAISSHYIHFDSPGNTAASATGVVRFSNHILGAIVRGDNEANLNGRLDRTDYLGAPTLYSDNIKNRGLEFDTDWFRISNDRMAIEFHFQIKSPGDYMRVITETPAPGSASLVALASLVGVARRRRA